MSILQRSCQVCQSTVDLESCRGCGLAWCCAPSLKRDSSRERRRHHRGSLHAHAPQTQQLQAHHRQKHESACQALSAARERVSAEEAKLRASSSSSTGGPYSAPPRLFEDHAGLFWDILETREYMRARLGLTERLLAVGTRDAAEAAVAEYHDLLRLSRCDALDVRHRLLGQLVRLGQDQACYERVKRWLREDLVGDEASHNVVQIQIYSAAGARRGSLVNGPSVTPSTDVFEEPEKALDLPESYFELLKLVPVLLIKIGLWLNLREMEQVYGLGFSSTSSVSSDSGRPILPPEMVAAVQLQVAKPVVRANAAVVSAVRNGRSLAPHIAEARDQAAVVARAVTRAQGGREFWDLLSLMSDPYEELADSLGPEHDGPPAQAAFRYNYASFLESPGALWAVETLIRDHGVADIPDYESSDHAWDTSDDE